MHNASRLIPDPGYLFLAISKVSITLSFEILPLFINESSLAYFSFAVANREPNKTDYDNGSPKSEKLLDFELGYKYSVSNMNLNLNFWVRV